MAMKLCSIFTVDKDIYRVLIKFLIVGKTKTTLFVYFFLHLFILQAIYIVLQDLKMKMLFEVLNVRLQG